MPTQHGAACLSRNISCAHVYNAYKLLAATAVARTQKNKATSGHLGMLKVCPGSVLYATGGWETHHAPLATGRRTVCSHTAWLGNVPSHTRRSTAAVALDQGTGCSPCAWRQAKLAKLRRELLEPSSGSGAGAGKGEGMTSSCCSPVCAACSRRPVASSVLLTALPAGNMGIILPGRLRDAASQSWRVCVSLGAVQNLGWPTASVVLVACCACLGAWRHQPLETCAPERICTRQRWRHGRASLTRAVSVTAQASMSTKLGMRAWDLWVRCPYPIAITAPVDALSASLGIVVSLVVAQQGLLAGFPSVGKSTLLNKLTGTFSEVRACPGRASCQ